MIDLQSISSNLLLVGFVLISICCLYLLYSNFTKIREINELKINVEDLKKIFFNQQKHNDEIYNTFINTSKNDILQQTNTHEDTKSLHTKFINIDELQTQPNIIKLTKENISTTLNNTLDDTIIIYNIDNKNINIELEDLDSLVELNTNIDDNLSNFDINDMDINNTIIDDNIYDPIHSFKNNEHQHIFDDNDSITTEPIIDDLVEANFDIDDLINDNGENADDIADDIVDDIADNIADIDVNNDVNDVNDVNDANVKYAIIIIIIYLDNI